MRLGAVRTSIWAICVGLAFAAVANNACAQETRGTWFSRLFAWPTSSAKKAESASKTIPSKSTDLPNPGLTTNTKIAQAEYLRRLEACDKLREIALGKNDPELMRQADQLEQRAWDLFVQMSQRSPEVPSLDETVLRKNLKVEPTEPRQLLAIPTVFGNRGETKNGVAARKE